MNSPQQPSTATAKKNLKPIKMRLPFKKDEIRQCRLCLRVLPKAETREIICNTSSHLRRKIMDAVGVRILSFDKVKAVCANCLLLVDIIYNFRMACRKAETIHGTRLLMMHPGKWMGEENKQTLANCHLLVQRNRMEMDGLFKCSGLTQGDMHRLKEEEPEEGEVLLEPDKIQPEVIVNEEVKTECHDSVEQVHDMETEDAQEELEALSEDSDPEQTDQWSKRHDGFAKQTIKQKVHYSSKSAKNYMCELCGQTMQTSWAESHHNKFHSGIRPYVCAEEGCRKTFHSRVLLYTHVKKNHLDPKAQVFECPTCSKKIKGKKQFENHKKIHTGEAHPEKEPCSVCGKHFYKRYLRDHMFVHTGELPYSCEFCDRKYAAKTNWMQHRKKYHADQLQLLEGGGNI